MFLRGLPSSLLSNASRRISWKPSFLSKVWRDDFRYWKESRMRRKRLFILAPSLLLTREGIAVVRHHPILLKYPDSRVRTLHMVRGTQCHQLILAWFQDIRVHTPTQLTMAMMPDWLYRLMGPAMVRPIFPPQPRLLNHLMGTPVRVSVLLGLELVGLMEGS